MFVYKRFSKIYFKILLIDKFENFVNIIVNYFRIDECLEISEIIFEAFIFV